MNRPLLILLAMQITFAATAQDLPLNTKQQLENLAEAAEEEPEDDALLQQLHFWQKRKLNLNTADADDLRIFPFLTPLQIEQFFLYKSKLGPLIDLHELQAIPVWTVDVIRQLLPYVQVVPVTKPLQTFSERLSGGEHQFLLRSSRVLQKAAGYEKTEGSRFIGDPNHLLTRYQYRHPDGLQWGLTAEKDAGEGLFKPESVTPDHLSAHLFIRRLGKFKALALGDFTANLGQGLVHWQSLAFGKGPAVLGVKRQSPVLRPHTGAGEALFLRGAGATWAWGRWEATAFAAAQKIHANTDFDSEGEEVITSFVPGGLHRTATELAQRKSAGQQVLGGTIQYSGRHLNMGINAVHYHFSMPVQKADEPYNLFAMQGRRFTNLSTDYSYTWRNLHLFGELAANAQGNIALVQGLLLSVHPKVDLALHGRAFGRGYTAIAANAFAESKTATNERGFYSGVQVRANTQWTLSAYADVYRFPWLRFRVNTPSGGTDYLVQAVYQPRRGTELYVRFRNESKDRNVSGETRNINAHDPYRKQNLRLHLAEQMGRWNLRSRAEVVWFREHPKTVVETGFLWFGELQYRGHQKFDATARVGLFETESYNSRLYALENDVLYGYSIPALWGKGLRSYLTLHYEFTRNIDIWGRCAYNLYEDVNSIGSGLSRLDGNQRTEIKLQLMLRLDQ